MPRLNTERSLSAMDFDLVVSTVLRKFDDAEIRYGVVGGFALGLWGVTRATVDIDFLLLVDDLSKAEEILSEFYYKCTYKSENVAQYASELAPYGQIDVLIAFRKIARGMLERSVQKESFGGTPISTLIPEDLVGLKLQASANDASRKEKDFGDIKQLIKTVTSKGVVIDWELLRGYFELFNRKAEYEQLKEEHG